MSILTSFLLIIILTSSPYAASLNFNFPDISSKDYEQIVTGGEAYVSDHGIQLTPELNNGEQPRSASGRARYTNQFHLWNKTSKELTSFSTSFSFVIRSMSEDRAYGDGLTFFLAESDPMINGGGAMGLPFNTTANVTIAPFVAVEFDTFSNTDWDPVNISDHVGINVNSLNSVRFLKWWSNIRYGGECHAWIDYDSVSKILNVSFTGYQNNTLVRQSGLNYTIDLRDVLPEWVIIGFSAATGASFQTNNVKSWSFNTSVLYESNSTIVTIPPATSPDPVKGKKKGAGYMVGLIGGPLAILVTLLVIVVIVCWKKRKNKGDEMEEVGFGTGEMNDEFEMGTGPRRFTYRELARSTGEFAGKEKLGEGGFGEVYKGFLEDMNMYVAVKRVSKSSKQGIKEYISEVKIISRLRHRNLVQLIGWCHENRQLLLVYEFMENGSLDLHLFTGNNLLAWDLRYKIARGLASALQYLHEEWEQCVLHRDIKSSNVMLDSNFNAKLGDFGLAKLVDHEKGAQTTLLAGTLGYMAPECAVTGKATKESDVFSFGVVALEITCGRKPIVYRAQENQIRLVDWVWELYGTEALLEGADPRLGSEEYEEEEMKSLMTVGLWCTHPDPHLRPSMRQVIQALSSQDSLPILPSKMPVASYLS